MILFLSKNPVDAVNRAGRWFFDKKLLKKPKMADYCHNFVSDNNAVAPLATGCFLFASEVVLVTESTFHLNFKAPTTIYMILYSKICFGNDFLESIFFQSPVRKMSENSSN